MSMFDDLFGDMFDLNGNGETSMDEMFISNHIISETFGKENRLFDDPFESYDNENDIF